MNKTPNPTLSRRRVFAGAGAAGAVAAVAAVLPAVKSEPQAAVAPPASGEGQSGYQETQHVLRYYQTARV